MVIPCTSATSATIKHHTFACHDISDEQEVTDMHHSNPNLFRLTLDAFITEGKAITLDRGESVCLTGLESGYFCQIVDDGVQYWLPVKDIRR